MTMQDEPHETSRPSDGSPWLTLGFALVVAILAVVQRGAPAPWYAFNLTMIGALGLWGGARLRPWLGLILPLAVWGVTDFLLWRKTGDSPFDGFVYSSILVYGLLGLWLRQTRSPLRIGVTCVLGSVQFFLVTNFGAWLSLSVPPQEFYARDLGGLLQCYAMGIPFSNPAVPPLGWFGNLLLGDLVFCGLLFGAHELLLRAATRRPEVAVEPR